MLEVARTLAASPEKLRRDVVFIAFSGEEEGVLGSTEWTRHPTGGVASTHDVVAMLNMDMVGRMRENKLIVSGSDSAPEWPGIAQPACDAARVECTIGGSGYGPSDQTPFTAVRVPVAFFFTGVHPDYHRPSDAPSTINAAGAGQVARIVEDATLAVSRRDARLTYTASTPPPAEGDTRSFGASLGTIPDYAGPPNGQPGVLLAGVRAGSAADKGGLRRGDILVKLGAHTIASVEDFMYALGGFKPGERATAVVLRDGKETRLDVTFEKARRR